MIEVRIWERGAGETPASGSSACAVAVAATWLGKVHGPVEVAMPGGSLEVRIDDDDGVVMRGPVEEVASIHWSSAGTD